MSVLLLVHTWGSPREKAAPREMQGSNSHWSSQTPGTEGERFQGDRGASSQGNEQRKVRTEEVEDKKPLYRLQDASQVTSGEASRGQSVQHCPSRETLTPRCNGRCCRVILRKAEQSSLFFKKSLLWLIPLCVQ